MNKTTLLRSITTDDLARISQASSLDPGVLRIAREICEDVRKNKDEAVRRFAERFGETLSQGLVIQKSDLLRAEKAIPDEFRDVFQRTSDRITRFASQQKEALTDFEMEVPGGRAGHSIVPIEKAGCYAPAGRYPLPSTVLMTASVAKVAGCRHIAVATPNPSQFMLAAASIAGADCVLPIGGAHAIAAMAYGTESIRAVDMIVGPGNKWVTAAKQFVSGVVGIDMLAGPSELAIIADHTADPMATAADLIAQAEHDTEARVFLVTTDAKLPGKVNEELARQLENLSTSGTVLESLKNGGYVLVESIAECVAVVDQLGPEHLQIQCEDAENVAGKITNAGCLFIGHCTAEVFGDYGIGPNHTLPTGNTARYRGGLSVLDFCRVRTWIQLDGELPKAEQEDIARLAELEGLAGHQAAALVSRTSKSYLT